MYLDLTDFHLQRAQNFPNIGLLSEVFSSNKFIISKTNLCFMKQEAEFKEFEPQLKYGWFPIHLKLYSMFQDLSRHSIETGFWWIGDKAQLH